MYTFSRRSLMLITTIFLCWITSAHPLKAQTKKPLSLYEISKWRTHDVALSDDGQWYTTLYSLMDKAKLKKNDSIENKVEENFKEYYKANNQTGVLYIFNAKQELKYEVKDGSNPVFSTASDWIAYSVKPKPNPKKKGAKAKSFIELKHLASGFTVKYESGAKYQFLEDKNYFVTSDENSLLIYDLDNRREHYIGNIGEYVVDKQSAYIAYTIASEDQRGNGIYLYNPKNRTTRALQTGSFLYTNLSWNQDASQLAAYKYNKKEKQVDYMNMNIVVIDKVNSDESAITEYPVKEMEGLAEKMGPAIRAGRGTSKIIWSKDGDRLFIKLKKYQTKEPKKAEKEKSTVQVWHWKDKKLLSERITEYDRKQKEVFDAIFFRGSNKIVQLTGEEMQGLSMSKGTDRWAIGTDNRPYISDWNVYQYDLYRVDLLTGAKKLIIKKNISWNYAGFEIAPNGKEAVYWDGAHYWHYDFATESKRNITQNVAVSFIDKEYDKFGDIPPYGFVGWVKGQNAIIVNHKYDLWLLPLDGKGTAKNLTASITAKDPIRFRIEDSRFTRESAIEDRYIDLSKPLIVYGFNTKTKYAGFFSLQKNQVKELIYKPASFNIRQWRGFKLLKSKKSDAIIYKMGDYQNYPEAYLSTLDFAKPKQLTVTNPQQEQFNWGKRILIEYTNDDGVPLQAILSLPEGYQKGQKLPMMVYSYEKYSWRMYTYATPYLSGASVPEMLYVSDGYLFLQPDIHFNLGTPHSDMHECIDAAIKKVIELGYVDENKIGYEGFSFGGHCGMYMATQKNRFAAIAAGAGVSNLVQGFNIDIVRDGSNEQDYYMVGQGRLGTDPTSNVDMYISESAVFNAQNMNTPLLLFHGTSDKVVQWEHSFGLYSILRHLQKQVVFLSYRGEGHGLRKKENRLDIQIRLKEYFDHYLKEKEEKKWMVEELPYVPEKGKEEKKGLPKWK